MAVYNFLIYICKHMELELFCQDYHVRNDRMFSFWIYVAYDMVHGIFL